MKIAVLVKHISSSYACNFWKFTRFTRPSNFFCSFTGSYHSVLSSQNDDIFSLNKEITSYFKNGDTNSAQKVFDKMSHRNVVTWNCMISGFARNRMINEARRMFEVMPAKNLVSWTAMLSGYIACGNLDDARNVFDRLPDGMKTRVCWDIMLNGYIKFRRIDEARDLFDSSNERNVGLWNRMLSGYVQMGCVDEAYDLFLSMPERDLTSWTNMITCYAKAGMMKEAKTMFDRVPYEKDATAWTAMIRGFMQNGMADDALKLFHEMPNRDVVAWNCVISGLVQNGRFPEALDLYERMPKRNIVSSNSILYGFVQGGDMISAHNFFNNIMTYKDVASWNTLISGHQTEEALFLFSELLGRGFNPDQTTYTTVASICGTLALHIWGKAVHLRTIKTSYANDTLVSSSLISMYSKCGLVDDAQTLFDILEKRDTVTWNTVIVAQAYHGSADKALKLYSSMIQSHHEPNHVTFLAILTACAHSGLVEEGERYFTSMENDWNVVPQAEHYSCMVDLFGRSGRIYEAYDLVKKLPVNFPSYAWETLLNYCKLHGNSELGELVAERILSINPSNAEMNVLLSNIYAAKGLWDESENVRTSMKQRDSKKEVGCSWVELGGVNL
ncbi:hypothetical protein RND81_02G035400 [Saponaria officinalis]|uniref:Uncharacterized protein n=1 Tax=Saponaria officinalis TaxID=3572 RepID=A0AAW1MQZ0_SAPOF